MHGYQTEVSVKEVARFLIQVKNLNRRSANLVFIPKFPFPHRRVSQKATPDAAQGGAAIFDGGKPLKM